MDLIIRKLNNGRWMAGYRWDSQSYSWAPGQYCNRDLAVLAARNHAGFFAAGPEVFPLVEEFESQSRSALKRAR